MSSGKTPSSGRSSSFSFLLLMRAARVGLMNHSLPGIAEIDDLHVGEAFLKVAWERPVELLPPPKRRGRCRHLGRFLNSAILAPNPVTRALSARVNRARACQQDNIREARRAGLMLCRNLVGRTLVGSVEETRGFRKRSRRRLGGRKLCNSRRIQLAAPWCAPPVDRKRRRHRRFGHVKN